MRIKNIVVIVAALLTVTVTSCDNDFRQRARGSISDVTVVMDSTQWESKTADAIRNTFGKLVYTLPNPEEFYNLKFRDIRTQAELELVKSMKNVIFVAPIDDSSNVAAQIRSFLETGVEDRVRNGESFAFPIKDQWFRDQYALILSSTTDSALAEKIINSERALLSDIQERELERWKYEVYEKKEQTQLSDSLWANYGFKVRIQHDYIQSVDTTNFLSFRRYSPDNDRWFWVWHMDDVKDINFLDNDWINAKRDSLTQMYVKGNSDDKYVVTEYRRPVDTKTFQKGNLIAYETLGTWRLENGAMGGPFVNFTYYDPMTERLFMVEYSQFAPKVRKKIHFVRQFRAMGRTFESDSTWTH